MKLGICYNLFDGEELLPYAVKTIRKNVDFISVVYQNISYFGNQVNKNLFNFLSEIKEIDKIVLYENNLTLEPRENECIIRNLGLQLSKENNCTHHISADTDEFYISEQLEYVKKEIRDFDCSVVGLEYYYKEPNWLIYPNQKFKVSFIHKVNLKYDMGVKFPYHIDPTRKLNPCNNYKFFTLEEFTIHHLSHVRKDIKTKLQNSANGKFYDIEKFVENFNKYQLGDKLKFAPDNITRRTRLVDNIFGVKL